MRVISPSVTCAHTTLLGSSLTFGSLPVSYFQQLQASLFLSLSLVFCQNQCSLWPFSDSITQHLFQLLVTLSGHHHWLSLIQTADHPIGVLPQRSPNPTSFILIEAGTHPDTHDFFSLISVCNVGVYHMWICLNTFLDNVHSATFPVPNLALPSTVSNIKPLFSTFFRALWSFYLSLAITHGLQFLNLGLPIFCPKCYLDPTFWSHIIQPRSQS